MMTRRPASASSAAATRPARPAPTTMASASIRSPHAEANVRPLTKLNIDEAAGLHRVADLVPKGGLDLGAEAIDRGDDGDRNAGRDQPIFDCGCAALIVPEPPCQPAERTHCTHHFAPRYLSRPQSSVSRCATSGTSAGGIGYSRSRFGRTQASLCPSLAITVPSHRRHTYSGLTRWKSG